MMHYKLWLGNEHIGTVSTTLSLPNISKVVISPTITMPHTEYTYVDGQVWFEVNLPPKATMSSERAARLGLKDYSIAYYQSLSGRSYRFNRYTGHLRELMAQEFVNVNDKHEVVVKSNVALTKPVVASLVDNKYEVIIRTDLLKDPYTISLELFHALKDIGVRFKCSYF